MKEAITVEKQIISLEKKNAIEERKSKKVSFKDDSKEKAKDPYDMEGLQKVLKTMSNEMVEIKKQVAETSTKKPFRNFRRNQVESKPPNAISNAESEEEEEEEDTSVVPDQEDENEEIAELHGMWDFILPNSDSEVE